MTDRQPRALRFVSAELRKDGDRCAATVELQRRDGETFSGLAEGACDDSEGLHLVARAAADAILAAMGAKGDRMEIVGTEVQETFGARSVFVKVDVHHRKQRRELMGFSLIDVDPARATVFALLSATNRFLGLG